MQQRCLRRAAVPIPGALVGVALERSPEQVVAFLGTLRAGAVYLPLDPSYPQDRLTFMIEDSGAEVVLSVGPPT